MNKQTRKEKIDALVADSFTNTKRRKCTLTITWLHIAGDTIEEVQENLLYAVKMGVSIRVLHKDLVLEASHRN